MTEFDAFHLPGFAADKHTEWKHLQAGEMSVRFPVLSGEQLASICDTIRNNRDAFLAREPVGDIVRFIDAAAVHLHDDLLRIVDLLANVTGYSHEVVRETMAHMLDDWRAPALNEMLRAELGDPNVLDRPTKDLHATNKQIAAYGFPLAFHVFSGNVPGVAVTSLIRSLLVKSATLGKTASGEPLLAVLFARAIERVSPELAGCLAVTYWPGGNEDLERTAVNGADVCIVYGGSEAVRAIAQKLSPDKRLVVHGPRFSFGIVNKISEQTAERIARSVAAFDQQGCVSPHVVYVTGDASRARALAEDVARKMDAIAHTLPRGRLTTEDAVAINRVRAEAEFGENVDLYGDENSQYSVIFETDPSFKLSCLNRVLFVKPIPTASDVVGLLPSLREVQSVALEGFDENEKAELTHKLGQSGVSRITTFERLPWPPMHWHHDGSSPLRELIWWLDIEA